MAIIGAGPSGLTCAYFLGRLGYSIVDVYEAQPVAGGMLAIGIPGISPAGIGAGARDQEHLPGRHPDPYQHREIGRDLSFADMRSSHDAVYIATGTQHSRQIGVSGENLPGVYHGLDFLRDINLGPARSGSRASSRSSAAAARRWMPPGSPCAKGPPKSTSFTGAGWKTCRLIAREIHEALEEGIVIHELVEPLYLAGRASVERVVCQKMKLQGFDRDGRRKPVSVPDDLVTFDVDLVIPAVSQYSDLPFVRSDEVELTAWGTFIINEDTQKTTMEGVFAGGDVVRGADVVITAIADGKKAAQSIDRYLGGDGKLNKGKPIVIPLPVDDPELVEHERFSMKCLAPETRGKSFDEVFKGFHKLNAIAEAMRCLRCDRR